MYTRVLMLFCYIIKLWIFLNHYTDKIVKYLALSLNPQHFFSFLSRSYTFINAWYMLDL